MEFILSLPLREVSSLQRPFDDRRCNRLSARCPPIGVKSTLPSSRRRPRRPARARYPARFSLPSALSSLPPLLSSSLLFSAAVFWGGGSTQRSTMCGKTMTTTVLCYLWKNICSCPAGGRAGRLSFAPLPRGCLSACVCEYTAAWPPLWHMSGCKEENG